MLRPQTWPQLWPQPWSRPWWPWVVWGAGSQRAHPALWRVHLGASLSIDVAQDLEKWLTMIGAEWQYICWISSMYVQPLQSRFGAWNHLNICFVQHRQKSNWNCSESWPSATMRIPADRDPKWGIQEERRDLTQIEIYPTNIWNVPFMVGHSMPYPKCHWVSWCLMLILGIKPRSPGLSRIKERECHGMSRSIFEWTTSVQYARKYQKLPKVHDDSWGRKWKRPYQYYQHGDCFRMLSIWLSAWQRLDPNPNGDPGGIGETDQGVAMEELSGGAC